MFKKYFLTLLTIGAFFTFLLPTQTVHSAEVSLKDWHKSSVANNETYVPARFSVTPAFNSEKTKVRTFGKTFADTIVNNNGDYYGKTVRDPQNTDKGKFGIYYDYIATYKGRDLYLKITVMDWSAYNKHSKVLSFGRRNIGFTQTGYNWVDLKWEFYYTDNNQLATDIDGSYMNVVDIDAQQGMEFDQATTNNIQNIYVTNDTWIKHQVNSGQLKIYESESKSSSNDDKFAQYTVLFNKGYSFRFKWHVNYAKRGTNPDYKYPTVINGNATGGNEFFGFNGKKLVATELLSPEKFIKSEDKSIKSSTLTSLNQKITYQIYHTVPDENPEFYYKNYNIVDEIPKGLKIESYKVFDEKDQNRTSVFDTSIVGNKLTLTAKTNELAKATFYNSNFRLEIVTVPVKAEMDKIVNNNVVTFTNQAKVTINGTAKWTDKVTTKLYRRVVTVNHIDKLTGEVIEKETVKLFDGENYSYAPKNNLKYLNKYSYTPIDKNKVEGIINGKDVVENIYYTRPNSDVSINKIQIFTDKAESGLPVKLSFIVNPLNSEWKKDKVVLSIYEKESRKKIISTETSVEQLEKGLELKIPPNNLSVNSDKNYEAVIEQADPIKVVVIEDRVDTLGYTASEKMLEQQAETNSKIEYKGVVMTEREVGKKIETYYETITLPLQKNKPIKSGYGLQMNQKIRYQNDIGINNVETSKLAVYLDSKIVDGDFYREENGKVKIELENEEVFENDTLVQTLKYPKVFIEEVDGTVFSEQQVNEQHESINHNVVDGGNKVYVPIWIESLGEYKYQLKNEEPIGVNEINVIVNDTINVEAYMYGHIGSETIENDEILIVPVDLENPFPNGLPDGWTESDLEWLQGN